MLQVFGFRGVEHNLVLYRLVGGAECWVVDGKEGQLRRDNRTMAASRHRIISASDW